MWHHQVGGPKDENKARHLYTAACEHKEKRACYNLGLLQPDPTAAYTAFQTSCKLGYADACYHVAQIDIQRAKLSPAQRIQTYQKTCNEGAMPSCAALAALYEKTNRPQDLTSARILYTKACDGGLAHACNNLGLLLEQGRGGDKDLAQARTRYEKACASSLSAGCHNFARFLSQGLGGPVDSKQALRHYEQSCQQRYAPSCLMAGLLLQQNSLAEYDPARSMVLLAHACLLKEPTACNERGLLNEKSLPADARVDFQNACDLGYAAGCNNLAMMLQQARGGNADLSQSRTLYKKACAMKDWIACTNLAALHQRGLGTPKDLRKARRLYRRACDHNLAPACFRLGHLLYHQNKRRHERNAKRLYQKACKAGYTRACNFP